MKITKGTIIRTIMLVLVLVNLILKRTGKPILEIQEGTVASFVETVIELGTIIVAWWENNSFTQNARKADDYLKKLNTTN
ncbi:MAG TPA: phage holin [Lachnoclostridium phytofermentans]|uniref:Phage holin n=1 Tax=Lachnoclostridium phytofermentans TaxID=66219 RepID=A0A3D2X8I7_9FIRM|nr:phage holin [Lachnoclostridium sp.]HCL03047.1 phage holin [Lachnoclostridium phytofermentans]